MGAQDPGLPISTNWVHSCLHLYIIDLLCQYLSSTHCRSVCVCLCHTRNVVNAQNVSLLVIYCPTSLVVLSMFCADNSACEEKYGTV